MDIKDGIHLSHASERHPTLLPRNDWRARDGHKGQHPSQKGSESKRWISIFPLGKGALLFEKIEVLIHAKLFGLSYYLNLS